MKTTVLSILLTLSVLNVCGQISNPDPQGLKIGDKAPDFEAKDQSGKIVKLKDMLKKGPVVLVFYRGQWCPYCNKHLSNLQDSLSEITSKKTNVIAISPETTENVNTTVKKTKAGFPVVSDGGMKIMKDYKVNFAVDAKTITKYKEYGIDFDKSNGSNGANLPVPATYIVGSDGIIKYVFFNPDYSKRSSVNEILKNL